MERISGVGGGWGEGRFRFLAGHRNGKGEMEVGCAIMSAEIEMEMI